MTRKEKLSFDKYEVELDSENLRFDQDSLTIYIQKEASFYDNFGSYLALAEKHLQNKEVFHEKLYCERFVEAKEDGGSDKLAEAKAKCDVDVVKVKEEIVEAKYIVNRLKNHLKAWDKSHDNAQSLGHNLRKQMDKLHGDIVSRNFYNFDKEVPGLDKEIEKISEDFETNLTKENFLY